MRWVIDRIRVLNPIRFTNIRRNEIDTKIPLKGKTGVNAAMTSGKGALGIAVDEHRQRASLLLRDVRYLIEAHFDILDRRFEKDGPELSENDVAGSISTCLVAGLAPARSSINLTSAAANSRCASAWSSLTNQNRRRTKARAQVRRAISVSCSTTLSSTRTRGARKSAGPRHIFFARR